MERECPRGVEQRSFALARRDVAGVPDACVTRGGMNNTVVVLPGDCGILGNCDGFRSKRSIEHLDIVRCAVRLNWRSRPVWIG